MSYFAVRVSKKYLATFKLFQTFMSFFLLLNSKEDIWKNVRNQLLVSIDFNSIFSHTDFWVNIHFKQDNLRGSSLKNLQIVDGSLT